MSGSLTVIGGHSGATLTGLVSVPSLLTDYNSALQLALTAASDFVTLGGGNLVNVDVAGGTTFTTSPSVPGTTLLEITNTDSLGAVTSGSISGSYTISESVSGLIVEAPGSETITGNASTSIALFGANSNVDYSVLLGSGSIFAAGGADSVSIGSADDTTSAYIVYSAGNDTVNIEGGSDSVVATTATTTLLLGSANGFVTADGNSTVSVLFKPLSSGNLNFVNASSGAATIYTGAYSTAGGTQFAENAVTAYGGAGGGYYVGGHGGDNSLVGGSGIVTLQGGGNGDYLEANADTGAGGNVLFSGPGAETLIGSSTSGDNTFQLNLKYVNQAVGGGGTDYVSTDGSGAQNFLMGPGNASTITGSTVSSAFNIFDLIRNSSVGGTPASYEITNFASINGAFYITDSLQGSNGVSGVFGVSTATIGGNEATTVTLNDGSTIKFDGVAGAGNLDITTLSGGAISISYHS
jgi:hypothetical protein